MSVKNTLTNEQIKALLNILKARFEKNSNRHEGILWEKVEENLLANPAKMESLFQMEKSEGEPDVIGYQSDTNQIVFCDCSAESPKERRSLCYDKQAWNSRKENKPKGNAVEMAEEMGIQLLDEDQYGNLQKLGEFDVKTSSWVLTPISIREKGGAIFCDKRFGRVFTYHNGAESYYAARGFRGLLLV
ncbi:MAG: DUF4256 domain-containing protein [Flavobacteriales bacterium]|nr:DUF4256 domain-containing protein [Flavobacteriales bacterium]NCP84264.1 DUF4256 domain-containing protein [Bacteroidota bacterium]